VKITWRTIDSFVGNFSSPELVHHRPCPVCGATRSKSVCELNDFQFFTDSSKEPKRVSVRQNQCSMCCAVYMNPCYSRYGFAVLFAEAGRSYGATEARPAEQLAWLHSRSLLQPGSWVLDVGCCDGTFLSRLPTNMNRVGVDIDGPAIERGRCIYKKENIEFIQGDFENFSYRYAGPDVITAFHVLEHLPRPVAVLGKLRAIATSTTTLVVEVPILENARTEDINGFLSVQHMTHFSRQSLRNTLDSTGWQILEWLEMKDYNGCRVLASPAGEPRAVRAEPEDIRSLNRYLASWYRAIERADERLAPLRDARQRVLWGAGMHTEFLYHTTSLFHARNDQRYVLVDSDPVKRSRSWRGIPIYPPDILTEIDWACTDLLISSYGSQESIAQAAFEYGVPVSSTVRLYDEVRVY